MKIIKHKNGYWLIIDTNVFINFDRYEVMPTTIDLYLGNNVSSIIYSEQKTEFFKAWRAMLCSQ